MSSAGALPLTAEERRLYAQALGSIRSERKAAAVRINGAKSNGRPLKPLTEFRCTCLAGEDGTVSKHRWECPLGRALKRRVNTMHRQADSSTQF